MADIVDKLLAEDGCWYECAEPGPEIFKLAQEIEQDQSALREGWKKYARAYSNRDEMGLDWDLNCSRENDANFVTENVVKSVIDTAASIIAKNRVKVRIMTSGPTSQQSRAFISP